jgi:hypothetical protein
MAITGLSQRDNARITRCMPSRISTPRPICTLTRAFRSSTGSLPEMSPPAQKPRPAPVMTRQRSASFFMYASTASVTSWQSTWL